LLEAKLANVFGPIGKPRAVRACASCPRVSHGSGAGSEGLAAAGGLAAADLMIVTGKVGILWVPHLPHRQIFLQAERSSRFVDRMQAPMTLSPVS